MFLWEDVTERLKSFEEESETAIKSKKEVLQKAYAELCFFFLLLDEGLVSGDAVMASSLWTLIYSLNSCKSMKCWICIKYVCIIHKQA